MHRVTRFRHQSQANLWSPVTLPLVTRAAMISQLEATVGQCHSTLLYIPRLLILWKKKKKKCDASLYNCGHVIISHYFNLGGAGKKKKRCMQRRKSVGKPKWSHMAISCTSINRKKTDECWRGRPSAPAKWQQMDLDWQIHITLWNRKLALSFLTVKMWQGAHTHTHTLLVSPSQHYSRGNRET